MKREVELKDISDGKLYTANDMVKADCRGCQGCSDCCRGMGNSIVLDPMDIRRLCNGLDTDFAGLMKQYIELNVVDGMILPNLTMRKDTDACAFLDENGRCRIHPHRPGICRMFPLGRYYEEKGFRYFMQIHECTKADRGKVKVYKCLDTPNLKSYEQYITDWHQFLLQCEEGIKTLDTDNIRVLTLYVLRLFYQTPYADSDFYSQFYTRLKSVRETLGIGA